MSQMHFFLENLMLHIILRAEKVNVAAIRKLAKKVSVAKVNAVACNRHSNNIVQREIE